MEVDEITVLSPVFPGGLTFGPVTLESAYDGRAEPRDELPVRLIVRRRRFLGIQWYAERYRTSGVFSVADDRVRFRPTSRVARERAAWWRRLGCWLLEHGRARPDHELIGVRKARHERRRIP
jgi:hypothetical protein